MLTPEEITQARALSSPEIPDDYETAKQPTRQLVRKMLAHIDELEKHAFQVRADNDSLLRKERAALDAKEKAGVETLLLRTACANGLMPVGDINSKGEFEPAGVEYWTTHLKSGQELYDRMVVENRNYETRCAELQAIVDRVKALSVKWGASHYGPTNDRAFDLEAALSAAASSGAKEKQS